MKIKKIAFTVMAVMCTFAFFSCDNLMGIMSNPIIPKEVLDTLPEATLPETVTSEELAALASDPNVKGDSKAAQGVVNKLSEQKEEDLKAMKPDEKKAVMDLTVSAVLPMETIMSGVASIIPNLNNNGNGDSNANMEEQAQALIGNVLKEITFVDTMATEVLLEDMLSQETIPVEEQPTVLLSVVSIAVSACKSSGDKCVDLSDMSGEDSAAATAVKGIVEAFSGKDASIDLRTDVGRENAANNILKNLSTDGSVDDIGLREMTSALKAINTVAEKGIDFSDMLKSMVSGFGGQAE